MFSKRAQGLKPSPTLALSQKALELKNSGKSVISLSLGEPSWDTYDNIKEEAKEALEQGFTKYTPASGTKELRQAIIEDFQKNFHIAFKENEVAVSSGAKAAIFSALQCLIDPGDEVLLPSPYWVSYPSQVELCGGVCRFLPTEFQDKFLLKSNILEKFLNKKTKILVLNSPNNPTGSMYLKEDLKKLSETLLKYPHVYILTDDIYNRLAFNQERRAPHILEVEPRLKERTIVVNGVSKSYSMTGWRIGWALGPQPLIKTVGAFQSQAFGCPNSIAQKAAEEAIRGDQKALEDAVALLKKRRDFAAEKLMKISKINFHIPEGTFYMWIDVSSCLGSSFGKQKINSSRELCEILLEDQGVVVVPGEDFGKEGFFRMNYALSKDLMDEAIKRMKKFFDSLSE